MIESELLLGPLWSFFGSFFFGLSSLGLPLELRNLRISTSLCLPENVGISTLRKVRERRRHFVHTSLIAFYVWNAQCEGACANSMLFEYLFSQNFLHLYTIISCDYRRPKIQRQISSGGLFGGLSGSLSKERGFASHWKFHKVNLWNTLPKFAIRMQLVLTPPILLSISPECFCELLWTERQDARPLRSEVFECIRNFLKTRK